jgi:hypothetical protein
VHRSHLENNRDAMEFRTDSAVSPLLVEGARSPVKNLQGRDGYEGVQLEAIVVMLLDLRDIYIDDLNTRGSPALQQIL